MVPTSVFLVPTCSFSKVTPHQSREPSLSFFHLAKAGSVSEEPRYYHFLSAVYLFSNTYIFLWCPCTFCCGVLVHVLDLYVEGCFVLFSIYFIFSINSKRACFIIGLFDMFFFLFLYQFFLLLLFCFYKYILLFPISFCGKKPSFSGLYHPNWTTFRGITVLPQDVHTVEASSVHV